MFYSHQLLARKAPLGQIWMAATIKAKINRRKLDKLDIIQICEEILNPSVPMALRLSGILMGGVVIVYERKVKLLYDDVTRFLVEINEAWKIKPTVDRTVLPKGKAQAKFEAVTLPEAAADMEVEQTMQFFSDASTTAARFQRMRLDDLDEHFININPRDEDHQSVQHHQADAANITLFDDFGSGLAETDLYNRFERFDIGEDEEIQMNFTPQEHPTLVPSPPREDAQPQPPTSRVSSPPTHHEPAPQSEPMVDEQEERQPEEHTNAAQEQAEGDEPDQKQQPARRRARRKRPQVIMDDEQIMIPGNIYQMWLQDASSIISKRARKTKIQHPIATTKISILMDLPPLALMTGLDNFPSELHYPAPLLKLWRKCTGATPASGSPSADKSRGNRQGPVSHSPPETLSHRNNTNPEFIPGDFQSEVGSQPEVSPIEKARTQQVNMEFQAIFNDADMAASDHFTTPRSPGGHSSGSIPSSVSGHTFLPHEQEVLPTSARYKKRQHSSARSDLGNLDPVEEEIPVVQVVRDFKIRRLSENRQPYDSELLVETAPTQTPHPVTTEPTVDKVTQSIRTHFKMHFDTPGNPQSESIDQLASGMNRKKAAQLFYQTCVLATLDFVKVHQAEAYAEILISRGPKM